MSNFQYPLDFKFKIGTISNDFIAKDASGQLLFYVREKILSWRDVIKVYSDESKSNLLYELRSNKLIDFQQTFSIVNANGDLLGKVRRKTLKSFWKSTFNIMDSEGEVDHILKEKSAFTKFWDGLFGEIPVVGMLSGYVFNPTYILSDVQGNELFEIKKQPSFFGRKFSVNKLSDSVDAMNEERLVLSLMLMVLIERSNG